MRTSYTCTVQRAITRFAGEAARGAAGRVLGGRRGGCGVRGRGRHGLFADHLTAHGKEAAVSDGTSCVRLSFCKLGSQCGISVATQPSFAALCGKAATLCVEQPSDFHKRVYGVASCP